MGEPWYILKNLLDRPNYTAHRDPQCGHLKLKSNPRRLHFAVRYRLGVHMPCQRCGGIARQEWQAAWDEYFANRITVEEFHHIRSQIQQRM